VSFFVWFAIIAGLLLAFFLVQLVYLAVVLSWGDQQTRGLAYYGRPPAEREWFKQTLRRHVRFLRPILRLLGRISTFKFENASFRHRGIAPSEHHDR